MKTLPTLTLAALLVAGVLSILWQGGELGAQPPDPKGAKEERHRSSEATEGAKPADAKESEQDAQKLLRDASERITKRKSINAKVLLNLNLVSFGFAGEGRYITGPDRKMLYEIEIQLPNTTGRLFEVCDGEILHTVHEIRPKALPKAARDPKDKEKPAAKGRPIQPRHEVNVTRRNVTTILNHLERQREPSVHQKWVVDLGLGGIPAFLASIDQAMVFKYLKADTLRNRPVHVIEGAWTPDQRAVWQPPDQKLPPDAILPVTVPDLSRIHLDQETGFPLRIVFLKRMPESSGLRTMVSLDFVDVKFDEPVDPKLFVYKDDPDHPAQELTNEIISRIAEAAAADGGPPPEGFTP